MSHQHHRSPPPKQNENIDDIDNTSNDSLELLPETPHTTTSPTSFTTFSSRLFSTFTYTLRFLAPLSALLVLLAVFLDSRLSTHTPTCPRTNIFPFDSGCPYNKKCVSRRPDIQPSNITFYNAFATWHFGKLAQFRADPSIIPDDAFQRNARLAQSFLKTEGDILANMKEQLGNRVTELDPTIQTEMHISLSYLCCLTENESKKAVQLVTQWANKASFNLNIQFDKLVCYHERSDSVTIIWEVSPNSERLLMAVNQQLKAYLEKNGIRVVVDRKEQMKFHSTVIGFHTPGGGNITEFVQAIASGVRNVQTINAEGSISFQVMPSGPVQSKRL